MKEKLDSIMGRIRAEEETDVGLADRADVEKLILAETVTYWIEKAVYAPEDIAERFAIPPQFSLYLRHYSFIRQDQWRSLFAWDSIIADMTYWYNYYSHEKDRYDAIMMLPIGGWSDKHWYFISCDKGRHFGQVFEAYDTDFYAIPDIMEEEWPDFFTFLESEF